VLVRKNRRDLNKCCTL